MKGGNVETIKITKNGIAVIGVKKIAIPAIPVVTSEVAAISDKPRTLAKTRIIRIIVLLLLVVGILFAVWLFIRPTRVVMIRPQLTTINETITSSGRVGGTTETNVGAQTPGIVNRLYVIEGSEVVTGQQLALIKNDVARAQIDQARAALETARTQLQQASRGALPSDVVAASELVRQAEGQVEQQNGAITQAERSVLQAQALLSQFQAERDLTKKELDRNTSLVEGGIISRSEFDKSATAFRIAEKKVSAQQQAIAYAESVVRSARSGLKSSLANVRTQQARLSTIRSGARPEDVAYARKRVAESENALRVAEKQAANAVVVAPFAGTVTKINTEESQTVGSAGVLTLVSEQLEVRVDVDESNLSALAVGQKALISSGAFSDTGFDAIVSEIAAAVNETRGTIEVKVVPILSPAWLRPGQTVDVNIVTGKNVERLLVPQTALARSGEDTVALVIVDGKIAHKIVETRPATKEGIPVTAGLSAEDLIVETASAVELGDEVEAE